MTAENKPKHDMSTTAGKLADLRDRYHEAVFASGEAAIAKMNPVASKDATTGEAVKAAKDAVSAAK
jgi:hypothetical protein